MPAPHRRHAATLVSLIVLGLLGCQTTAPSPVAAPRADLPPVPVAPPVDAAPVAAPSPSEAAITAQVANPVVLNADTKVETNRAPFEGTKVETNSQVQASSQAEAEFEEIDLGNGTVLRSYTGVQPGVVLVNAAPEA